MELKGNFIQFEVPKGLSQKQTFILKNLLKTKAYSLAMSYVSSFKGDKNFDRNMRNRVNSTRYSYFDGGGDDRLIVKREGSILELFLRKHDIFGSSPKPGFIAEGLALGIEIECFIPKTRNEIRQYFRKNKIEGVKAGDDASIRTPDDAGECPECDGAGCSDCPHNEDSGYTSVEFRVLTNINDMSNLEQLCGALRELNADVNQSCGLHVHLDLRGYKRLPKGILKRLTQALPMLKGMVPKSRLDNQYCRQDVSSLRGCSRYAKLNVHSFKEHRTIEVRMHSGTVSFEKISNWAKVLHSIAFSKVRIPESNLVETSASISRDFLETYAAKLSWSESLYGYVAARLNKFNPIQTREAA